MSGVVACWPLLALLVVMERGGGGGVVAGPMVKLQVAVAGLQY